MVGHALRSVGGRPRAGLLALALPLAVASCFVDDPGLATTGDATGGSTGSTSTSTSTDDGGSTAAPAVCGDGRVEGDEACDEGELNGGASECKSDCTLHVCGDGVPSPSEECDDGDDDDLDGCSSACVLARCGDGVVQLGEGCDDGNTRDGDGCRGDCVPEGCGDGVTQAGEACDDGNLVDDDACTNACTLPTCGDGIVQPDAGEACDDGPDNGVGQPCTAGCQLSTCGDGLVQAGEGCDDGNAIDGDGCSSACVLERRRVFVTTGTYNGALGGREGADERCQSEAADAGLSGIFRAWIADGTGAPVDDFTAADLPYVRVDGVQVAAGWVDLLDGQLDAPIRVTAKGLELPGNNDGCSADNAVWTNTTPAGARASADDCEGWTQGGFATAAVGRFDRQDAQWTAAGCKPYCMYALRLYCVEQAP